MLKPETLQKLRTALKMPSDATDAAVAEKAAEVALTPPPADKSAEVTALSADKKRLEGELKAATDKVLSLSADAKPKEEPNALSLSLINRAFKTDREQVIASGTVSEAGMKEIDALLGVGSNGGVALTLSAGGTDPLYTRLCEILRRNPGIKTNNAVQRPVTDGGLRLSADVTEDAAEVARKAEAETRAWQDEVLRQRGLTPHVATA